MTGDPGKPGLPVKISKPSGDANGTQISYNGNIGAGRFVIDARPHRPLPIVHLVVHPETGLYAVTLDLAEANGLAESIHGCFVSLVASADYRAAK